MHRSTSHIGSLNDYKPKNLWKSMRSKENGTNTSNAGISTAEGKTRTITRSQTMSNVKKRSSLIISEPTTIRNAGLRPLSVISSSANSVDLTIDPKEREFYASLQMPTSATSSKFKNRHRSIYFGHGSGGDDDEDSLDFGKSPTALSFINMDEEIQAPDMLSSTLEDYRIFTKKSSAPPTTLTTPIDEHSEEYTREMSMSSLPSFCSTNTMDSEISVLHVSNSLWIGTTITDLEEEDEGDLTKPKNVDYFEGFDPQSIFADETKLERTDRTSLIFV